MSLYKALSDEELAKARFNLLEDGEYDAFVRESVQRSSKTGNVMADMRVSVFDKDGNAHEIRDFLVFTRPMLWKVKNFCDSAGLGKEYFAETFTPDMAAQRHCRVKIRTKIGDFIPDEKLNGKAPGAKYPDKNVIDDYVVGAIDETKKVYPELNDDIPF